MPAVNLRHLRYFVAVAEELHFGRAAKRLKMAQPPLSQQIRGLERHLGVDLFERTSRRVELTRHGILFLEEARAMLRQADRMEALMHAASRGYVGKIGIGFAHSALYSLLSPALREFHLRHPSVELHCLELTPVQQIEALHQREIDAGFYRSPLCDDALVSHRLVTESVYLALPEEHPLAKASSLRLAELEDEPFIAYTRQHAPAVHDQMLALFREAGFAPRVQQEGNDLQTAMAMAAAGLGVAMVPSSVRRFRYPGLVFVALDHPVTVELSLVLRREEREPVVLSFLDACRKVAARPLLDPWGKPCWTPVPV